MEREGEMRKERRGRRGGGEMRKGIVIGGMVLGLLMGCNNGGEDPQKVFLKSVVGLGNNFLDIFTSFGEMAGGVLGFNAETKKSEVGAYFKKVKETVEATKTALNKIVSDMKEKGNPNASATESEVNKLVKEKLEKIIEGASEAIKGAEGNEPIANVAVGGSSSAGAGVAGEENAVRFLSEGIGKIVDVVLKGKGSADAGTAKKADALSADRGANAGDSGKLFGNTSNSGAISSSDAKKAAVDASKAVGAVTGADILQAMVKVGGDSAKLAANSATKDVAGVATDAKDATIAGGMALRAMAKGGKFANDVGTDTKGVIATEIKGAAISAVTKSLDTLTIAIRKAIDEGLKSVKEAMNISANDNPATSETTGVAAK